MLFNCTVGHPLQAKYFLIVFWKSLLNFYQKKYFFPARNKFKKYLKKQKQHWRASRTTDQDQQF